MKTPEEMAEEYAEIVWDESELAPEDRGIERHVAIGRHSTKIGFLAGYKAAMDEVEAYKDGAKDVAKKFNELIAAKDQVADVRKVMPQWISVKDRLPDYDQLVLIWHPGFKQPFVGSKVDSALMSPLYWWRCELDMYESEEVITHWMPLPAPPKEEK